MASRKNAMLTTEDRRWLTGEKAYEGKHAKQQRYQRRKDIRERVYNSILDFTILFEHLEEDERRKLFGEVTDDGRKWLDVDAAVRDGVRDALAFLFRGIGVTAVMRDPVPADGPLVPELLVELGLYRAGQRDGFLVEDVRVDIEATEVAVPELLDDLQSGADVSPAGLYLLAESGALDTEVVQECIREQIVTKTAEGE